MYVDESGDHTYQHAHLLSSRYLSLTGVFVATDYYREVLHPDFLAFRQEHFPHSPDDPVILHRTDIINCRGPFRNLTDPAKRAAFDGHLLGFLQDHDFALVTVVIDKLAHLQRYALRVHPYNYSVVLLVGRYWKFLESHGAVGDVLAESRGGTEDRLLKAAYEQAAPLHLARVLQAGREPRIIGLSSKQIKLKKKAEDVCGLQVADLLAHPCKQQMLLLQGAIPDPGDRFWKRVWEAVRSKCDPEDGRLFLS